MSNAPSGPTSPDPANSEQRTCHSPASENRCSQPIPDVQSAADERRIPIDKVGVTDIRVPIALSSACGATIETVATVDMFVSLAASHKGTHMSRFLELLHEHRGDFGPDRLQEISQETLRRLNADRAFIEARFPYFLSKKAPVSRQVGLLDYQITCGCEATPGASELTLSVTAPATSLCPCSKEISKYGAHNQRCEVTATVRFSARVTIEELIDFIEAAASCPVYSVLKRTDEKHVTEQAFDNPKFVEDIVRDLALSLDRDERIHWYKVESKNMESIHNHNAYALIERDKNR